MARDPFYIDRDSDDSFSEYPDLVYEGGLSMDQALAQHYGIDTSDWAVASKQLDEILRAQGVPPLPPKPRPPDA